MRPVGDWSLGVARLTRIVWGWDTTDWQMSATKIQYETAFLTQAGEVRDRSVVPKRDVKD